jgi:NhaP-type Na+/H+ or K+/H+ antiporter
MCSLSVAGASATDSHHLILQLVSVLALAVSRALNVWPNAALVNYGRPPDLRIPQAQQFMMWFSGMRGAMAFAMVLRALEDLPGKPRCSSANTMTDITPCSSAPSWSSDLQGDSAEASPGIIGGFECAEAVAHVLLVVTFFLILLTVLVNGGAAATVMRRLKLRDEDDVRCWSAFGRQEVGN